MGEKSELRVQEELAPELLERMEVDLKGILMDIQSYCNPHSLARVNPVKWLEVASELCKGTPPTRVANELGARYNAVVRIQAQLSESPIAQDLKRELAINAVENLNFNAEIAPRLNSAIISKLDAGEADEVSLPELLKAKRELGVDTKLTHEVLSRLRGDNVQKIEVTQKTESYEDMLEALRKAQEQIPKKAEVINIED